MNQSTPLRLSELAKLFLKQGIIGFGGPAAHIAMMEEEVVEKRKWISREHFLDLIGATNLIPGPNSTEMAIHVGYSYAGIPGLIVAGICFILPAVLITTLFAWIYTTFGTLSALQPLLYGIKPAVLAVIIGALWRLGKKAFKNTQLLLIAFGVIPLLILGINEAFALLLGGILGMFWLQANRDRKNPPNQTVQMIIAGLNLSAIWKSSVAVAAQTVGTVTPSIWQLGLFFLKVGTVLFGSGYVLIAFLEGELVNQYGWLTQQQLLDAIAIGQFTPGPILSTSSFIGYVIAGFPGAIVATIGIFLPSFLFVAMINPLIPKLRQSSWASSFLDAVNVSAVALMGYVTLQLARNIFLQTKFGLPVDLIALLISGMALIAVIRFRINAAFLVMGGAILGWLFSIFTVPIS
ncbi:MAG: chromate efflux transporter [Cyanobacteria bacterium P01_A01_bin.45]